LFEEYCIWNNVREKEKDDDIEVRIWIEDPAVGSEVVELPKAGGSELFLYPEKGGTSQISACDASMPRVLHKP
jgi:hypothetical protein